MVLEQRKKNLVKKTPASFFYFPYYVDKHLKSLFLNSPFQPLSVYAIQRDNEYEGKLSNISLQCQHKWLVSY